MSFKPAEKIGRPGPGVSRLKNIYVITLAGSNNTNPATKQLINDTGSDTPAIQVKPGTNFTFKFTGFFEYKRVSNGGTAVSLGVAMGKGFNNTNVIDLEESHNDITACPDTPVLTIAPSFIESVGTVTQQRLSITINRAGPVGSTLCKSPINRFTIITTLSPNDIVSINNQTWAGGQLSIDLLE